MAVFGSGASANLPRLRSLCAVGAPGVWEGPGVIAEAFLCRNVDNSR
jgi:hypothetical protein